MKRYLPLLLLSSSLWFSPVDANRKPEYAVDEIFLNRWSARAMSGEAIADAELMALFDAARWAPSEYNKQPWHFIYVKRGTKQWHRLFDLLVPFNQEWCKNASALVLVTSRHLNTDGSPLRSHSFDTGAACENLALQGSLRGLVVHTMAGFDYERAKKDLHVPHDYTVEAMIAIGHPASPDVLPEGMRELEKTRSGRKPVKEFVSEGSFHLNIKG
jgi:nitroreductase